MSFFPVIELVDRYTIALLKHEKTNDNQQELDWYTQHLQTYDVSSIQEDLVSLYNIHKQIWSLEAELKAGKENNLSLEEIGRRAIKIRNWNHERIALKNTMAEKLNRDDVREKKFEHLSE